jgi:CubicO group peptidase (beta-lactamase class C family)
VKFYRKGKDMAVTYNGFIPEAENRIRNALKGIINSGFVPGNGVIVGRRGEKAFELYEGKSNADRGTDVGPDTIFRMYSMTKILTVASVMQLWDRGIIRLNDKLSDFISEFEDTKVAEHTGPGQYMIRNPEREIRVYDLLTMTSGIPYDSTGPTGEGISYIVERWKNDRKCGDDWDTLKVAREIAKVPLLFDPGKYFQYGLSHDILGAVIEVVTGKNLCEYMKENLFEPLGMKDACFEINDRNRLRIAEEYGIGGKPRTGIDSEIIDCMKYEDPKFYSGGAGLLGTADDYFRFARMLANNGMVDGIRVLSRKAIEMMRTPQLNTRQLTTYNSYSEDPNNIYRGYNYGFGVRVCTKPGISAVANSLGEYGWAGALGTWVFIDPQEELFAVYVHQKTPVEHEEYVPQIIGAIYSSLE